jgi:mono/diheme cytochrome c family protein
LSFVQQKGGNVVSKWVRRTSIALAALALLGVAAAGVGKVLGERKMARNIALQVRPLDVVPDVARVDHGRYLYNTRGCAECHGVDGAGKTVVSDAGMLVVAPNITAGPNGVTAQYRPVDWVRTVRHGVKPNGHPVMVMPSDDYSRLSDEDMAALVAYLQQMRPVSGVKAVIDVPVPVKALYAFGAIKDASEKIDHTYVPPPVVPAAITPAYGAYVAATCTGCHGADLAGGRIPGAPPAWPPAARLAPGKRSAMHRYPTPDAFMAMLRTGHRPDGTAISRVMPFGSFKQMNETDMRALYAYLKSVPATTLAQR